VIEQLGIALTGVTAVFLSQSKHESRRRYACIFGLAGQPFWFVASISTQQWGVFLLALIYTFAWAAGMWTHWLRPKSGVQR
jgi:hypothetical protein